MGTGINRVGGCSGIHSGGVGSGINRGGGGSGTNNSGVGSGINRGCMCVCVWG